VKDSQVEDYQFYKKSDIHHSSRGDYIIKIVDDEEERIKLQNMPEIGCLTCIALGQMCVKTIDPDHSRTIKCDYCIHIIKHCSFTGKAKVLVRCLYIARVKMYLNELQYCHTFSAHMFVLDDQYFIISL